MNPNCFSNRPGCKIQTAHDCEARSVMTPWQKIRHTVWLWRANRAFDNRDQHEPGTPAWKAADVRLRKVFGE